MNASGIPTCNVTAHRFGPGSYSLIDGTLSHCGPPFDLIKTRKADIAGGVIPSNPSALPALSVR